MSTTTPTPAQPQGPAAVDPDQSGTSTAAPRRTRRNLLWGGLLGGALVVGGGTAFAVTTLSGGGAQPDEVLPGNAIAYVRMDIDPSAGQKIAAVRLLRKLPQVNDAVSGGGDPRQKLFESLQKDSDGLKKVNYDRDVKPWLGDRLGVAVMPSAEPGDVNVALAVQVKDEEKAKVGLDKLMSAEHGTAGDSDVAFRDGYALLTEKGKGVDLSAALDKGTLAANTTYAGDMKALGEQGVLSGWTDAAKAVKLAQAKSGQSTPAAVENAIDKAGRLAFALRFDASYLELAGIGRGAKATTVTGDQPSTLTELPADTAVAVSVANAGEAVGSAWDQILESADAMGPQAKDQIDGLEQQLGLSLPKDLQTLLGKRLLLALPEQELGGSTPPKVGLKVTTDAAKAEEIVGKLEKLASDQGAALPLVHAADGDAFYLATSPDYLNELKTKGALGADEGFLLAVPGAGKEQVAAYVSLDRVENLYLDRVPSEQRDFVKALRSVGVLASSDGKGGSTFSLRLVGN
jgi:hypothetical protein